MVLHHLIMADDDKFILSKGHSAGALYVTLWSLGLLTDNDLETFADDDTILPGHPSGSGIPKLLFPTGSLGHGPSLAAGLALAIKHADNSQRVFCLCSDGEWQEGSCWEALIFSVHHRLDNLVILVDQNGLQGFGSTDEVISCSDLTNRLAAFGPIVEAIDGHDLGALFASLSRPNNTGRPTIVVMNTVKAKGLHFEGLLESHYLPLTDQAYKQAIQLLEA